MATTPAADFSQPIYMDEPAAGSTSSVSAGQTSLSNVPVVDLNDPNLLSQEFDANSDIDAYAAPPPIPDGRYLVKIKQIDVKDASGNMAREKIVADPNKNKGVPYVFTAIEATIIDPSGKFDNVKVWDRFVSTMTAFNGGVPIVTILKCLGLSVPARVSARQLMDMFFQATASEPELEIETAWEGGFDEATREEFKNQGIKQPRAVIGMHRFPAAVDDRGQVIPGKHQTSMDVDTQLGKRTVTAQVRINGYYPKSKK